MPELTPADFAALFTREALRPFQPQPGAPGLTPVLEVWTMEGVQVFLLADEDFNDGARRREYLGGLGRECRQWTVLACRFGSEAWMRSFSPEEAAARGQRLVESYPDRVEAVIVMGQMRTGETHFAQAQLYRRPSGAVERLGPWNVKSYDRLEAPLLAAFWAGYAGAAS
jgi:hypothetical protein